MSVAEGGVTGLLAGRYAIERELGQGATATVHLARDTRAGISVAIKVLRAELAESGAAKRFLKEIRRTGALDHPRILRVLDAGEHDSRPYFVLPYMEGGTLRQRLRRKNQLGFEEAIAIAKSIAEALDYAHAQGLVHRDVKPENILFTGGVACLGDFGIARALQTVYGDASSSAHIIRGTPAYMSPEQAAGEADLDGRSDQYSLACVIYEMITGMPAFMGPTPESIIAQRFAHPPRELRVYRPAIPSAAERALGKALGLQPADRYVTSVALVEALEHAITEPQQTVAPAGLVRKRGRSIGALLVLTLAASMALLKIFGPSALSKEIGGAELDSLRYAVMAHDADLAGIAAEVGDLLPESLRRWRGINVVDGFHVKDARARAYRNGTDVDLRHAAALVGAGRYVRIQINEVRETIQVRATLHDTRSGATLARASAIVDRDLDRAVARLDSMADALLFPNVVSEPRSAPISGTTVLQARQAFLDGQQALERWDLHVADSAFSAATEFDPQYAHASLWLALVRHWKRDAPSRWAFVAENAAGGANRLSARDSVMAMALVSLARGDRDSACRQWRFLAAADTYDFAGWYGLGNCLRFDAAVVRDARSPSGWRFRSNYNEALAAYERAFRLLPSMHRSFRGGGFDDVQRLYMASGGALRFGRAIAPETTQFLAYPSWRGDSLEFIPLPSREFHAAREWTASKSVNEALLHQRRRFHQVALMWRAAFPQSVDAMEAHAIALDLLGDPTALDTLRRARVLAVETDDKIRTGVAEVWTRLKMSLPRDTAGILAARLLADSLVEAYTPTNDREAVLMGSMAALTGRSSLAVRYARMSVTRGAPAPITQVGPALVTFAAMGGPADSIHALEQSLARAIETSLAGSERNMARSAWLVHAASLALPVHYFETLGSSGPADSYRVRLLHAVRNASAGDARTILSDLGEQRRRGGVRSFDITTDGLFAEAAVLEVLGEDDAAREWLDPSLDSLSLGSAYALASSHRAASLVRLMALRADIAVRAGDVETARRWALPVTLLWSDADDAQRPTYLRMRTLVVR